MQQEEKPSTVDQFMAQTQELQDKVNALNDAREFVWSWNCEQLWNVSRSRSNFYYPWLKIKLCPRHSWSSRTRILIVCLWCRCQRPVYSVPVASLFTQCVLIQNSNITSGPHKKLVSRPWRTRSLEGVWPLGRFRSTQRLWAQAPRLLQYRDQKKENS